MIKEVLQEISIVVLAEKKLVYLTLVNRVVLEIRVGGGQVRELFGGCSNTGEGEEKLQRNGEIISIAEFFRILR